MAEVGVLYNLKGAPPEEGEPPDSGAEFDSEATVLAVAQALREHGHEVHLVEGDIFAYPKLAGAHLDIVFNMSEGIRGESRESHIPAILEMLGIPYTGSGVLALALSLDKPMTKKILCQEGVPTPKFLVASSSGETDASGLQFPLFVKPAHEGSSMGITSSCLCRDPDELSAQVKRIVTLYGQPALVEEFLPGREFTVGIIGNKNPLTFPIMEINYDQVPADHGPLYSRSFKTDWFEDRYYLCPAPLSAEEEAVIQDTALRAYRALGCRDLARVDLRMDRYGVPNVMEINPLPGLVPGFSDYVRVAGKAGWSYTELINGILASALLRNNMESLIVPAYSRLIA